MSYRKPLIAAALALAGALRPARRTPAATSTGPSA